MHLHHAGTTPGAIDARLCTGRVTGGKCLYAQDCGVLVFAEMAERDVRHHHARLIDMIRSSLLIRAKQGEVGILCHIDRQWS